jgi:hypothetical protein
MSESPPRTLNQTDNLTPGSNIVTDRYIGPDTRGFLIQVTKFVSSSLHTKAAGYLQILSEQIQQRHVSSSVIQRVDGRA